MIDGIDEEVSERRPAPESPSAVAGPSADILRQGTIAPRRSLALLAAGCGFVAAVAYVDGPRRSRTFGARALPLDAARRSRLRGRAARSAGVGRGGSALRWRACRAARARGRRRAVDPHHPAEGADARGLRGRRRRRREGRRGEARRSGATTSRSSTSRCPTATGVDAARSACARRGNEVPVIMMSGHATIDTAVRATRLGALDFLEKPLSTDRAAARASRTRCASSRAEAEATRAPRRRPGTVGELVGESRAMHELREQIARAAKSQRHACSSPASAAPARSSSRARSTCASQARARARS